MIDRGICKDCLDPNKPKMIDRLLCKECWAKRAKDRYHSVPGVKQRKKETAARRHPEFGFKELLERKNVLSFEDYRLLLELQEHQCKICLREFDKSNRNLVPVVDHDHKTGRVRGILCCSCNLAIGNFGESIVSLNNAISYLQEPKLVI